MPSGGVRPKEQDEKIHAAIAEQVQKGVRLDPSYWRKNAGHLANQHSLRGLYDLARIRKVAGKGFFGYGNWYGYLQEFHKVNALVKENMPDQRVHELISQQVRKGIPLSASDWVLSAEPVNALGHSLTALHILALTRKIDNKSFFGYGSWYEYLRQQQGINALDATNMPDERVHELIAQQLRKRKVFAARKWRNATLPVTSTGQSLNGLYNTAVKRKREGIGFFGYGSWKDYLVKRHGVDSDKLRPRVHSSSGHRKYSDRQVRAKIQEQINAGVPLNLEYWKSTGEITDGEEKTLGALLSMVLNRKKNGKNYFGHESWFEYLRKEHGINALDATNMPDERVHELIKKLIQKQTPQESKHWVKSIQPTTTTNHSLSRLHHIAMRRKLNGKSFFGYGKWSKYLDFLKQRPS